MCRTILMGLLAALPCFGKGVVGEDATAFTLPTQPASAQWVNGYVRSFFTNRIDIGKTVFPAADVVDVEEPAKAPGRDVRRAVGSRWECRDSSP